jgi:hypothetical protein
VVGHHTNCGIIYNNSGSDYNVTRPEWGHSWVIPSGQKSSVKCQDTFGWCSNMFDVLERSFRFYSDSLSPGQGTERFLMFMEYATTEIKYAKPPPYWMSRIDTGISNVGCCNVYIGTNHLPTLEVIY